MTILWKIIINSAKCINGKQWEEETFG